MINKVIIASDSFKESMSAKEACRAIEKGIKKVNQSIECVLIPMADGGEGTTDILMEATHSLPKYVETINHYGQPLIAKYGFNKEKIAIMNVAETCGLELIPKNQRNLQKALSDGLGIMMLDALKNGAKKIIIGLGGSGTNDGGFGMLYMLGARFFDKNNQILPLDINSIQNIHHFDLSPALNNIGTCEIIVASDVENVFTGPLGATFVFAKQKGASKEQLHFLENSLKHFEKIAKEETGILLSEIPGSGSAGGIGGALYLLNAKIQKGIDIVLLETQFQSQLKNVDYIITGEGSIDGQTIYGKTISGIAKIAQKENIPVIALGGRVTLEASNLYEIGVTSLFSITPEAMSLDQALKNSSLNLEKTTENVFRLLLTVH